MKPTIVESQLLRASASKGSLSSHLLSKYRASLEACFEDEELTEYAKKEHSYGVKSRVEYSLGNPSGEFRSGSYDRENDASQLPEWLTEGRGNKYNFPFRGSSSHERFEASRYDDRGRLRGQAYGQYYDRDSSLDQRHRVRSDGPSSNAGGTGWWSKETYSRSDQVHGDANRFSDWESYSPREAAREREREGDRGRGRGSNAWW